MKLSDIIEFNPRETLSKGAIAKKIAMEKLEPFTRDIPEFEYLEFRGGTKFRNGDTLMARITPSLENGKTSKVNLLDEDEVGFGSTEFIVVRAKENISDENFVYYLMIAPNIREVAIKSMVGTSGRQRVQLDVVKNHEILCPPLKEQIRIGKILKALDDKIENNKKINHHLEQMAQAIFKSWFVDFEPFGGKMPNDWTIGKLSDVLKLIKNGINDKDKQKLPYVPIDILPMHSLSLNSYKSNDEAKSSLITFKKNDILLGAMRVYFHRVCISPFTGITRSTCFVLRPFNKIYLEYCLLTCDLKSSIEYAQSTSKGSTMPYAVWENGLAELKIPIPTEKVIKNFSKIVSPLIKTLQDSIYEIENLQNLRDTLLPKLLSGEISVNQATK